MKKIGTFLSAILIVVSCNPDKDFIQEVLVEESDVPTKVSLIFPENNSECTTGTVISENVSEVTFDWSDAEIGDTYRITLTNLTTGADEVFDSETSSMPLRLLRGTPYSWKVTTSQTGIAESTDSNTESFYNSGPGLQSFIPFPASEPNPMTASSFPSNTTIVNFEWVGSDLDNDIIEYDFYFGVANPPNLFAAGLTENNYNGVEVSSGNAYYWKVATRDSFGNVSNSQVFYFTVR